MALTRNLRTK